MLFAINQYRRGFMGEEIRGRHTEFEKKVDWEWKTRLAPRILQGIMEIGCASLFCESIDDTAKSLRLVKEDVHNAYDEALAAVL